MKCYHSDINGPYRQAAGLHLLEKSQASAREFQAGTSQLEASRYMSIGSDVCKNTIRMHAASGVSTLSAGPAHGVYTSAETSQPSDGDASARTLDHS